MQRWLRSLRNLPVVGDVAESLSDWWSKHPFRPVAKVASDASTAAVAPVAQRHPLLLVSMAAAAGALLLKAAPWKWAVRSVLYAGLVPQVASKIVSKLPVESWFTVLGTLLASKRKAGPSTFPTATAPLVTVQAATPVSTVSASQLPVSERAVVGTATALRT